MMNEPSRFDQLTGCLFLVAVVLLVVAGAVVLVVAIADIV